MNKLLEEIITDDDYRAMTCVQNSDFHQFDKLCALAGLNKATDLIGADLKGIDLSDSDLRGFNFMNADLRGAIKNGATIIDETTIFSGANIEWIEQDQIPIVLKMQIIKSTKNSAVRQERLSELINEYGKTRHIIGFLIAAAEQADTLDEIFDYFDYLPIQIDPRRLSKLKTKAAHLLRKRLSQTKGRQRSTKVPVLAIDSIVERMRSAEDCLTERVVINLARAMAENRLTVNLSGFASITERDLQEAIMSL